MDTRSASYIWNSCDTGSSFDCYLSELQNSVPAECTTVLLRDVMNCSVRDANTVRDVICSQSLPTSVSLVSFSCQ